MCTVYSKTFVNRKQLNHGKRHFVEIKHGDIITFGELQLSNFIYKFCTNDLKKPKFDDIKKEEIEDKDEDLEDENIIQFKEEKTSQNNLTKRLNTSCKHTAFMIKQRNIINYLTKKVSNYQSALTIQKGKNLPSERSEKMIKYGIKSILKRHIYIYFIICPICNDEVFKAKKDDNSDHIFCESCINTLLNDYCSNSVATNCTKVVAIDSFVTELCQLVGGAVNAKRDNI